MEKWINELKTIPVLKKWSQSGEEGYIEHILNNLPRGDEFPFIVDIGASDGVWLSNTKYFREMGYDSLLIDGNPKGNPHVNQEFITRENIIEILHKYDCPKRFDLLSLDLDGNDFWILKEMMLAYRPRLIVCEINGTIPFGVSKAMVYNPAHVWNHDDYYGFSFDAGLKLAGMMGYTAVFQNDALNLYLVDKTIIDEVIHIPFKHLAYHPHNPKGIWETI